MISRYHVFIEHASPFLGVLLYFWAVVLDSVFSHGVTGILCFDERIPKAHEEEL